MRSLFASIGAVGCLILGLGFLLVASVVVYVSLQSIGGGSWGVFDGKPLAAWNDDGRNMTIESDFAYIDPRGKRWDAPKGSIVNGASIPRSFWTFIGGPFEGQYRNASVVHDVYCETMSEPSGDVHFMFYEACRCGGVPERKAKLLYYAVSTFGPQWQYLMQSKEDGGEVKAQVVQTTRSPSAEELERIKAYFDEHDPDAKDIPYLRIP